MMQAQTRDCGAASVGPPLGNLVSRRPEDEYFVGLRRVTVTVRSLTSAIIQHQSISVAADGSGRLSPPVHRSGRRVEGSARKRMRRQRNGTRTNGRRGFRRNEGGGGNSENSNKLFANAITTTVAQGLHHVEADYVRYHRLSVGRVRYGIAVPTNGVRYTAQPGRHGGKNKTEILILSLLWRAPCVRAPQRRISESQNVNNAVTNATCVVVLFLNNSVYFDSNFLGL